MRENPREIKLANLLMENATRFNQQTTDAQKIAAQKPFKHV